ncbi:MAG: hypothetical protein AAF799_32365 [Myxococcota bacterium]
MAPDWKKLEGGYRTPYDPRDAVQRLRDAPLHADAWNELWNELHHQGDVGDASYAAIPLLVEACRPGPRDWNLHLLVATIEVERHRPGNPALPGWVRADYERALADAGTLALQDLEDARDPLLIRSAMSVVALAKGDRRLGALLMWLDDDELEEFLEEKLAWTSVYEEPQPK